MRPFRDSWRRVLQHLDHARELSTATPEHANGEAAALHVVAKLAEIRRLVDSLAS
jgi:hypothetical protein